MDPDVQGRFNFIAREYEATRRKFIPDFDTFYQSGIRFLQCGKPAPRVLDLGAGTGLYASKLLERFPRAEVTLIDFAGNMLDIARENFTGNPNVRFIQDDYSTHDFAGEKFDVVISALSIHHFDDDGKRAIYKKVFSLLNHDGEFLNADQIASPLAPMNRRYCDLLDEHVRTNASEADYRQFLTNIRLDRRSPILPQLDWLRAAGFGQADCIFQYICFAVMYARRRMSL